MSLIMPMIAAPTALLGAAAGGWWALAKRLPALDDEEWPYLGYASSRSSAPVIRLPERDRPVATAA